MLISVNGTTHEVQATTLAALLDELNYGDATIATALNQSFVRAVDRGSTPLQDGDAVEVVSPRQGG